MYVQAKLRWSREISTQHKYAAGQEAGALWYMGMRKSLGGIRERWRFVPGKRIK